MSAFERLRTEYEATGKVGPELFRLIQKTAVNRLKSRKREDREDIVSDFCVFLSENPKELDYCIIYAAEKKPDFGIGDLERLIGRKLVRFVSKMSSPNQFTNLVRRIKDALNSDSRLLVVGSGTGASWRPRELSADLTGTVRPEQIHKVRTAWMQVPRSFDNDHVERNNPLYSADQIQFLVDLLVTELHEFTIDDVEGIVEVSLTRHMKDRPLVDGEVMTNSRAKRAVEPSVDNVLEGREVASRFWSSLDPDDCKLLRMRYDEEIDKEIAANLDISRSLVTTKRKQLSDKWGQAISGLPEATRTIATSHLSVLMSGTDEIVEGHYG